MKKNNIALLIISLIAIASMVGYVSYSIIAMGITNDEYNVFATASNGLVFTADGGNNFTNNVTDNSMIQGTGNNIVAQTNDSMNITLQTDGQKGICCSYDITWVWDNANDVNHQYKKTANSQNEFVLEGQFTTTYNGVAGESISTSGDGSNNFSKQLPDYDSKENQVLYRGNICNKNSSTLSTNVKQSYTLHTKFYNLTVNQDALRGKTFKGHIQIANIKCTKSVN